MDEFKAVIFTVNQEEFGLNIENVISIEKMLSWTAIPAASKYIRGIVTIRGNVTPIIDLRIALGHEEKSDTHSTRIIVINMEGNPVGLVVDAATDVLDISNGSIQQPDLVNRIDFIQGISKVKDRLLFLIDTQKLLQNMEGLDALNNLNLKPLKNEAILY